MSEIDKDSDEFKQAVADAVAEEVKGLKAKNSELIKKNERLSKGKEILPEELEAAERLAEEWKEKAVAAEKAAKKANADLEAATKRATEIDSAYSNTLKDAALTQALAKAGVTDPVYIEASKALLGSSVQVVDVDGKRVVKAGEVDLDKHITEWAGSDAGKRFVAPSDSNGGGSQGSRGNPSNGDKLPDVGDKAGRAKVFNERLAAAAPE